MVNMFPIIGWLLSFLASVSISIPFYVIWTAIGIGEKYFDWLPQVYQSLPFWDCVWLVMVFSILKLVLFTKIYIPLDYKYNKKK